MELRTKQRAVEFCAGAVSWFVGWVLAGVGASAVFGPVAWVWVAALMGAVVGFLLAGIGLEVMRRALR